LRNFQKSDYTESGSQICNRVTQQLSYE